MNNLRLAPSLLAADFASEQLQKIETAHFAHIDVMDGVFVPNISTPDVPRLREVSPLVFDVHLMVESPIKCIPSFARAGADILTFHVETADDTQECIKLVKSLGKKVGVALKPQTPVEEVFPIVKMVDMILVMSVEPGYGGQKLIEPTLQKARALRNFAEINNPGLDIEMDGGITLANLRQVIDSGVNVVVAGTSIFNDDIHGSISSFLEIFGNS